MDEYAVGDAATLEIALEGEQAVGREFETVGEGLRLIGVRVVRAGRLDRACSRLCSPLLHAS